jgi:hypothetical protein
MAPLRRASKQMVVPPEYLAAGSVLPRMRGPRTARQDVCSLKKSSSPTSATGHGWAGCASQPRRLAASAMALGSGANRPGGLGWSWPSQSAHRGWASTLSLGCWRSGAGAPPARQ